MWESIDNDENIIEEDLTKNIKIKKTSKIVNELDESANNNIVTEQSNSKKIKKSLKTEIVNDIEELENELLEQDVPKKKNNKNKVVIH